MKSWQKLIFMKSSLLCGASFVLTLWLGFNYWQDKYKVVQTAKDHAELEAIRTAKQIDTELRKLMSLTTSIADDLSSGALPKEQLFDRLTDSMDTNPQLFGVGVAYVPSAYDPDLRLYAPYYVRKDEKVRLVQLETLYDYTELEYDWYHAPLAHGPVWIEPFFGEVSETLIVEFAAPFYRHEVGSQDKIPIGVIHTAVSLDEVSSPITSLDLGAQGYGFLLSKKGAFLFHPLTEEYVKGRKTIFALAESRKDARLRGMEVKVSPGESGVIDDVMDMMGHAAWKFYEPIPSTGWSLGVVLFKDHVATKTKTFQRQLIQVALAFIGFVFFLSTLLLSLTRQGTIGILWWGVLSTSVLCIAGIGSVWYVTFGVPLEETHGIAFVNRARLEKFMLANTRSAIKRNTELPIYIPTGVFVQSVEFVSANNVNVTGYIWQKYSTSIEQDVSRGVILPEAVSAAITEVYRRPEKNMEVIGWYVKATLREGFDYAKYPFDQQNVSIRLWHKDFSKNVILVPDFESYRFLDPMSRPGLEKDVILPGWHVEKTFYGYKGNSYNANFGISSYVGQEDFPELHFNIIIMRDIANPFFSNIGPLIVASFIAFALLKISTKQSEKFRFLGSGTVAVVAACSTLFFVVILSQIHLRERLWSEKILYIEYFYFTMYIAIFGVILNAILFWTSDRFRFIQYHDNLIPKLLYWPVILGLLLGITLFIFY